MSRLDVKRSGDLQVSVTQPGNGLHPERIVRLFGGQVKNRGSGMLSLSIDVKPLHTVFDGCHLSSLFLRA